MYQPTFTWSNLVTGNFLDIEVEVAYWPAHPPTPPKMLTTNQIQISLRDIYHITIKINIKNKVKLIGCL